ncbi:Glycine-rich cell wall protein [Mesorhizobium plurifarium]|uniref:Glycine-rich cell wall protein n=1 Tax=Mesorhizobium plurifarium TaxID=69974 RepID=A0A090E5Y2_MESPL|nr:Glycine-rich cell wall protein [Mesorhizobium plurifarium]
MRVKRRGCRLVLRALTALALVVAPFSLSLDGPVVTKAYAGKGGGGGGNGGGKGGGNGNGGGNSGNGNGGGNSGNSGSAGGSNSGSAGGSNSGNGGNNGNGNSGGNNGNGNSGGNNGNGNSGGNNGNGNSGGNNGNGNNGSDNGNGNSGKNSSASAASTADVDDHVNALTGDKVEATRTKIQVTHRNGMKEKIENGRFRMEDKYGRTIVDRKATMADLNRLKSL